MSSHKEDKNLLDLARKLCVLRILSPTWNSWGLYRSLETAENIVPFGQRHRLICKSWMRDISGTAAGRYKLFLDPDYLFKNTFYFLKISKFIIQSAFMLPSSKFLPFICQKRYRFFHFQILLLSNNMKSYLRFTVQ